MTTAGQVNTPLLSRVRVAAGSGTVRFVGQTAFAAGKWVGIELDAAGAGKNDGTVQGKAYFQLEKAGTLSGVFVRPSQVHLHDPQPVSARPGSAERDNDGFIVPQDPRPGRAPQRTPEPAVAIEASPPLTKLSTPRSDVSRLAGRVGQTTPMSGMKRPAPASRPSSTLSRTGAVPGREDTGGMTRTTSSSSVGSVQQLRTASGSSTPMSRRESTIAGARTMSRSPSAASHPAGRAQLPSTAQAPSRAAEQMETTTVVLPRLSGSSHLQLGTGSPPSRDKATAREGLPSSKSQLDDHTKAQTEAAAPARAHASQVRAYEELQSRYRLLQAGRAEDRERLKDVEKYREDAQSWTEARPKLQAKIVELAAEVKELRRTAKDAEIQRATAEDKLEDLNEQLEMAALDKEVAEEKAEDAVARVAETQERLAALNIELDMLRKDEQRIVSAVANESGADASVTSSLAYITLAKQNERLKEALLRLRDMTTETEKENKRRISDLEKELDVTGDIQAALDATSAELESKEVIIESLKLQLDDLMGTEDMLERLTERNIELSEALEKSYANIQDLEILKDVADETEEFHVENEKHLQAEIDKRDVDLRAYVKQFGALEDRITDYHDTILQFRGLVQALQNDNLRLRQQQATQQTESEALTSQAHAMLSMNLKLQSNVTRQSNKHVENDMRDLLAVEVSLELEMIRHYLPPSIAQSDLPGIKAAVFFHRLAGKAQVLATSISQLHHIADGEIPETVSENHVATSTLVGKVIRLRALCTRVHTILTRCGADVFLKMGTVYLELLTVEKRLDAMIELSKKQELRIADTATEIDGFFAQAAFLAESHLGESDLDRTEKEAGYCDTMAADASTTQLALAYVLQTLTGLSSDVDANEAEITEGFFDAISTNLNNAMHLAASAYETSRDACRRLTQIGGASSALAASAIHGLSSVAGNMRSAAVFASKLANAVYKYSLDIKTSQQQLSSAFVIDMMRESASDLRSQSKDLLGLEVVLRSVVQATADAKAAASKEENIVMETSDAPWVLRSNEMHAANVRDTESETKLLKMDLDIKELSRELRSKESHIQEANLTIELLRSRVETMKKAVDESTDLQAELMRARNLEQSASALSDHLQMEVGKLEREVAKFRQLQSTDNKSGTSAAGSADLMLYSGSLETTELVQQIQSLRSAVRYLRSQNSLLCAQTKVPVTALGDAMPRPAASVSRDAAWAKLKEDNRALMREAAALSANARIVNLAPPADDAGKVSHYWRPREATAAGQIAARTSSLRRLKGKADELGKRRLALI